MALTPKQQAFINEYMIDLNSTASAIRAGYSARNADKIGPELLGKTRVREAIQQAMDARSKRTGITADKVLNEIASIAYDDISNYLDFESGDLGEIKVKIKDSKTIDTKNISEISIGKDGQFKFKLYCRDTALTQLGKHLKLFTEKIEETSDQTITIKLEGQAEEWSK